MEDFRSSEYAKDFCLKKVSSQGWNLPLTVLCVPTSLDSSLNPNPETSLAGAVHSGLTLVPFANVQYGGFLVFAYFRAALFGIKFD